MTTSKNPFSLPGILFVVFLCLAAIGVSTYYKYADPYCRYNAERAHGKDRAPECRDLPDANAEPVEQAAE